MTTCGDVGGRKADGLPCRRAAKDGGPCASHKDDGLVKVASQKARFLELYGDGFTAMSAATQEVGVTRMTLWRWRQDDPDFNVEVEEAIAAADRIRLMAVEDSMFQRIIGGDATGAETIFWLINRSDGRWKDVRRVVHSGRIFHGVMGAVASLSVHEVERIMGLSEEDQRTAVAALVGDTVENGALAGS